MPQPHTNTRLTDLKWHKRQQTISLRFADGTEGTLSAEFLRVFSPSAEVRGHGGGEAMLVIGKEQVKIVAIEPVGRYAVKLVYDDGHDSGLYDWNTLHDFCLNKDAMWQRYIERLEAVGLSRATAKAPKNLLIKDLLADNQEN
jgi:DUF971 family protein